MSGGDPRIDPRRVEAFPSVGRLTSVGAAAVLVPGIVVFAICVAAGLSTGSAGGFGLLAMLCGMGWYPVYLRRLVKRVDAQVGDADR